MLINIKADRIEKIVSNNNITLDSSVWKKSFLYDKINSLRTDTKFEITDCLQLIIAKGYGVLNQVIEIISLLKAIDYKIDNLALKSERGYLNLKFFDLYGNQKSDLIGLHKIIKLFKSNFNYLKIFGIMQTSSDIILKAKIEFNQRSDYFKKINLNKLKSKFDDYNIFKVIQNKGLLNNEYGFLIWLFDSDYISNYLSKEISNNKSKIKNWCLLNYIDYQSIINFLINYQKYTISVIASKRNYDSNIDELSSLDWIENISSSFKKSLSNNSIENKILRTFILANPINNAVKLNINNYTYKLITTNDDTIPLEIGSGKPRFRNSDKINSLCSNLSSCLSYLKIKEINNYKYISIITGTYPGELSKAIPFYFNRENFKLFYNLKDKDNNYRLIKVYGKNWEKIINEIENNWSIMNFVWQSPELPVISEYISNLKIRLIKN